MKEVFPIEFDYHRQHYFAIVRARQIEQCTELKVRIMNAKMDRLFYGHHVFNLKNNHIVTEEQPPTPKLALLSKLIRHSIEQHFTEDQIIRLQTRRNSL